MRTAPPPPIPDMPIWVALAEPRTPPAEISWLRRFGMTLGGALALAGAVAFRRLRA